METNKKISITLFLTILSSAIGALIYYRGTVTHSHTYYFLIWNLILAWIPYLISTIIDNKSKHITTLLFFGWLLFFPNAHYIVTDLFHLRPKQGIPFWYDTLLLFSSSTLGLLLGAFSMLNIYQCIKKNTKPWLSQLIMIGISFLASFGIYIGRYERWNSWDIVQNPTGLFMNCIEILQNQTKEIMQFSLLFGCFIYLSYLFIDYVTNLSRTTTRYQNEQ